MKNNDKTDNRIKTKIKMAVLVYAMLATYPAYCQIQTWTTATLDAWASERVGVTATFATDMAQLEEQIPSYLKEPLPMKKPARKP